LHFCRSIHHVGVPKKIVRVAASARLRYFSSTSIAPDSAGPFTSFDPVGFAIFATQRAFPAKAESAMRPLKARAVKLAWTVRTGQRAPLPTLQRERGSISSKPALGWTPR
jgi:hypothetical protein